MSFSVLHLGDHLGIGFEASIGQVRRTIAVRAADVGVDQPGTENRYADVGAIELRAKGLHHADERKFRSGILSIPRCFEKDVMVHRLHRGQATKMSEHGTDLIVLTPFVSVPVPAIIANAGKRAARRFVEFFTANIQNPNTRETSNAICAVPRLASSMNSGSLQHQRSANR
jgi:hypothetical protein